MAAVTRCSGPTARPPIGFGGLEASAHAINTSGVVVGDGAGAGAAGQATDTHAFIDKNGTATDLNTLIPAGSGVTLSTATGVNDQGDISGIAVDLGGNEFGFELIPAS
jgi:probable HAF family extracellular repeat protein